MRSVKQAAGDPVTSSSVSKPRTICNSTEYCLNQAASSVRAVIEETRNYLNNVPAVSKELLRSPFSVPAVNKEICTMSNVIESVPAVSQATSGISRVSLAKSPAYSSAFSQHFPAAHEQSCESSLNLVRAMTAHDEFSEKAECHDRRGESRIPAIYTNDVPEIEITVNDELCRNDVSVNESRKVLYDVPERVTREGDDVAQSCIFSENCHVFVPREMCYQAAFLLIEHHYRDYEKHVLCSGLTVQEQKICLESVRCHFFDLKNPVHSRESGEMSPESRWPEAPNVRSEILPVQFPLAHEHVIWFSPILALCMSTEFIFLLFANVSQVVCCICPLVVWCGDRSPTQFATARLSTAQVLGVDWSAAACRKIRPRHVMFYFFV